MDKSLWFLAVWMGLASAAGFPEDFLSDAHAKFEYKYSLKPPMLVNGRGEIPFWERGGDAIPADTQIRVAPSIQDRRGWLWTKNMFDRSDWTIDIDFSITGKHSYGADGMAFWYTANKGTGGPVFGNTESFIGLGVVIDTFDNNGQGDSPRIAVYISDGNLRINQGTDGLDQDKGHCVRYIRNKKYGTKLSIIYYKRKLEVWVHEGDMEQDSAIEKCLELENLVLPATGYFGISAATGGLSDDHDVKTFLVHSLITKEEYRKKMIAKYDQQKMEQVQGEYLKQAESFDTKKSQYRKVHEKQQEGDWERRIEMEENVQLIYDMQHSLRKSIKEITVQVESLKGALGRQDGTGGGPSDNSALLAAEGRMTHHLQEMKSQLDKVTGGSNRPASEQMQPLYEMKESVKQILAKVNDLEQKTSTMSGNSGTCPSTTCLSTWFFVVALLVQSALVVVFLYYKHSQERNAKKFF